MLTKTDKQSQHTNIGMRISYKIPLIGVIALVGATVFMLFGVYGFVDDSFNQSPFAHKYMLTILAIEVVYFFISPRNRPVAVDIDGISIPNILLPPFKIKHIKWRDVKRIETRTLRGGEYGGDTEILTIYTNYDSAKIYSGLCLPNFYLFMNFEDYDSLKVAINDFDSLNKHLRWLFRQIKNDNPIDPHVKRSLKKKMEDMIAEGLANRDQIEELMESINHEIFGMSITERSMLYKDKRKGEISMNAASNE